MEQGVCDKLQDFGLYTRRANDAFAAATVLTSMPDIDAKHIFLQGYSDGAGAATFAVRPDIVQYHDTKFAGVVAFYPFCLDYMTFAAPTLMLAGEKDELDPSSKCQTIKDKTNLEVVVYPGATHAFALPGADPNSAYHPVYDEKAAQDALQRVDAFVAAHLK